nr:MAG TPA: hypothetical protein [Caudoviricetes sp.]
MKLRNLTEGLDSLIFKSTIPDFLFLLYNI